MKKSVRKAKARVDKMKRDVAGEVNAEIKKNGDKFEATALRVIAAVGELNDAIAEAHKNSEMRVELWAVAGPLPRVWNYRIYKLTHAIMSWHVHIVNEGEADERVEGNYEPAYKKPDTDVMVAGRDITEAAASAESVVRVKTEK